MPPNYLNITLTSNAKHIILAKGERAALLYSDGVGGSRYRL